MTQADRDDMHVVRTRTHTLIHIRTHHCCAHIDRYYSATDQIDSMNSYLFWRSFVHTAYQTKTNRNHIYDKWQTSSPKKKTAHDDRTTVRFNYYNRP